MISAPALLRRAMVLVLAGIALHICISLWLTDPEDWRALEHLSWPHLVTAALLALVPWGCNALRVFNWLRWLGVQVRYARVLRIVLSAELGAAVTPSAVGGAPFKAGMLMELGLSAGRAVSLTSLGSLEDLTVILLLIPLGVIVTSLWQMPFFDSLPARILGRAVPLLLVLLAALVLASLLSRRLRHLRWLQRATTRVRRAGHDFLDLYRLIGRRGLPRFAGNVAISALQWFTRYSVLTMLIAGLGIPVDPIRNALLQWFCFALMAATPTPGAVGGAEAAFLFIHGPQVPRELVGVLLTSWRFLTFYFLSLTAITILSALELYRRPLDRRQRPPYTASTSRGGSWRRIAWRGSEQEPGRASPWPRPWRSTASSWFRCRRASSTHSSSKPSKVTDRPPTSSASTRPVPT